MRNLGWPRICGSPASASLVLGLYACALKLKTFIHEVKRDPDTFLSARVRGEVARVMLFSH
jgi:hypothetical protein